VPGGYTVETLLTTNATDATHFAHEACNRHVNPVIVAAGGDGTVNAVLNGIISGAASLA